MFSYQCSYWTPTSNDLMHNVSHFKIVTNNVQLVKSVPRGHEILLK